MIKTPTKRGSIQEPFELLYRNGEAATSSQMWFPKFSDISPTKASQAFCEDIIKQAKAFDGPIRSDKQCQQYIDFHTVVDSTLADVRSRERNDRDPIKKILSQIAAAVDPWETKFIKLSHDLKERITQWRAVVLEGQRKEQERLEAAAEEKRNQAKYTDDPKKARQATVEAKQLEKAAKEAAPKAEKGIDTEEYWVVTIVNRTLAAKFSDEAVPMDVNQAWFNQRIKERQHAGDKITPNMFPGLDIERKTRVRFHK